MSFSAPGQSIRPNPVDFRIATENDSGDAGPRVDAHALFPKYAGGLLQVLQLTATGSVVRDCSVNRAQSYGRLTTVQPRTVSNSLICRSLSVFWSRPDPDSDDHQRETWRQGPGERHEHQRNDKSQKKRQKRCAFSGLRYGSSLAP